MAIDTEILNKIKEMTEIGIAAIKISLKLNLPAEDVRKIIKENRWVLKETPYRILYPKLNSATELPEEFIKKVVDLYEQGVAEHTLGDKFSIRRDIIRNWTQKYNVYKDPKDARRHIELNDTVFDIVDSQEKAYWLGFFYADGYNCKSDNIVRVTLQLSDIEHLEKMARFFEYPESKITTRDTKFTDPNTGKIINHPSATLTINSKYLCESLENLGAMQAKSLILKFPQWLQEEYISSFIRGYIDGDGSFSFKETNSTHKEFRFNLASTKEFCDKIRDLIFINTKNSLILTMEFVGDKKNKDKQKENKEKEKALIDSWANNWAQTGLWTEEPLIEDDGKKEENVNTYTLNISGNEQVAEIADFIYANSTEETRLTRKYELYQDLLITNKNRNKGTKDSYFISDNVIENILQDSKTIKSLKNLSNKYNLPGKTIRSLLTNSKSKYFSPIYLNNQKVTRSYIYTTKCDQNKTNQFIEDMLSHIRKNMSWVYSDFSSNLNTQMSKIYKYTPDLKSANLYSKDGGMSDICYYFGHSLYHTTSVGKKSIYDAFHDDNLLIDALKHIIGIDNINICGNDLSFLEVINNLKYNKLVHSADIFKPRAAKYFYAKYSNPGDNIFDFSAGAGGRLIGCASLNDRHYLGVDPLTTPELQNIVDYFTFKNVKLICGGSEEIEQQQESIDFILGSPLEFGKETFSNKETQADFYGEDYFYNNYWRKTLTNIHNMLKQEKYCALQLTDKKLLKMACEQFGKYKERIFITNISELGSIDSCVYVFQK